MYLDNLHLIGCVVSQNKAGSEIKYSVYCGFIEPHLQDEFVDNIKEGNYEYLKYTSSKWEPGLIGFYIINVFQKKDSIKIPTFVLSGKNLGKKNATNIEMQTIREATSVYNKYKRNNNKESDLYPPMLASKYNDKSGLENVMISDISLDKEYFIEYKFDGNRAVAFYMHNKLTVYSRERKLIYPHIHLSEELELILKNNPGKYLDGELYIHGIPLQKITGQVRKQNPKDVTIYYEFYVFDLFDPTNLNVPYITRREQLDELVSSYANLKYIKLVDYVLTDKSDIVQDMYLTALRLNFEGLMLKDPNAPYEYSYKGYHSKHIKKIKPCTRREYEIVGYETGVGKNIKCVTLILKTETGQIFKCSIKNTIEYREELYELWKENDYFNTYVLGTLATVEFQSLSDEQIPLRGTVIEIHQLKINA
jgi:DNA ligase 1